MNKREKFESIRAAAAKTKDARDEYRTQIEIKYGKLLWAKASEQKRYERLCAAYDRQVDRMFKLLEPAPREWRCGVPFHWVVEKLSFDDAFRPKDEPLSVEPPRAFGY